MLAMLVCVSLGQIAYSWVHVELSVNQTSLFSAIQCSSWSAILLNLVFKSEVFEMLKYQHYNI